MGHVIYEDGVAMDKQKVDLVLNWPQPTTLTGFRGFLGLAGYHRRFIKGGYYFRTCTCSSEFPKEFVVEIDALREDIGAVLAQGSRPIAFSKSLSKRNKALSVYQREFISSISCSPKVETLFVGKTLYYMDIVSSTWWSKGSLHIVSKNC
ncbi:uncharacterized protein [Nicotiana tomentosiformis]|uniref:uncharacterized protein n=1 Tax=Nicotiana tomentosiformis TaxID=4098 RepID=UPI00388C3E30